MRKHSVCRWSFGPGKGGFLPGDIRPAWAPDRLDTAGVIHLVNERIRPRVSDTVELGFEMHVDTEVSEQNAESVSQALTETGISIAMITPGAHSHFGYGGLASMDPREREAAADLGRRTLDLAYGPLRKNWDSNSAPTYVIWNGSWGYDLVMPSLNEQMDHLVNGLAALVESERAKGGALYFGLEPKPNEGHPAMLVPTVASAILIWHKVAAKARVDEGRHGVNMEIGHSEMIGLDPVHDVAEQLAHRAMTHFHINSQGVSDGVLLGGAGKFDIDFGARINGVNVVIAAMLEDAGYDRWFGHDMQPRPYDNEEQAINRMVRSINSWEACAEAATQLDRNALRQALVGRNTSAAEDILRAAVADAQARFNQWV